jgi:4-aminobutyrate aminotransferase-like enzyme
MKQILALNAFDPAQAAGLDAALAARVARRARLFGAASVLFYERPLTLVRGEGAWVYEADGTPYLDVYNNVPSVGHCHPKVVAAVSRQLARLNIHSRYLSDEVHDFAERLLATFPPRLSNVTLTCTGSESNDLALRLAMAATGGRGFVVTETAYHGNTALVTEISPASFKSATLPPHVRLVPAPDPGEAPAGRLGSWFAARVAEAIADLERNGIRFAAFLADSIFSSDGVFADPPGFLAETVEVVHRAGGLYVADEVQPGYGRTWAGLWGFSRHGTEPDIVTMGKPMGNGYPMAGVVTRPEILSAFCSSVGYFNTFGGSAVAAAAGGAVLDVIQAEGLIAHADRVGRHLREQLTALAGRRPAIVEVRGAGLFIGIELAAGSDARSGTGLATRAINGLRERHVLIGAAGRYGNVLKVRPPLCFSAADADHLVEALDATLEAAA